MTKFIVGVDLGQAQDYTAISVLERLKDGKDAEYHLRHIERVQGKPYPAIVDRVARMMRSLMLKGDASLVADATGVGAPVVDLFGEADLDPIGIFIHGGDRTSHEDRNWRVPKRDLVGCLQVHLQTKRLKIAKKLPLGPILQQEMLNFRVKIDPATAHDSYSAWREQDHDDLVLSVALACWWGEREADKVTIEFSTEPMVRPYPTRMSDIIGEF